MYDSIRDFVLGASEEELTEFFTYLHNLTKDMSKEDKSLFHYDMDMAYFNRAVAERYPEDYVEKYFQFRNLLIKENSTEDIVEYLKIIISKNEKAWKEYKEGNDKAIGRFIGLLGKEYKVDPKVAKGAIEANRHVL